MKLGQWTWAALLVVAIAHQVSSAVEEEKKDKKKKLQIGVKKRPDECKTKSRKGDTLHMHYTVFYIILLSLSFKSITV